MQTKTIQIDQHTVHYIEAGDQNTRPVVLLHGNVGDAHFHWQHLIPELAEQYHILAPDLPGYGKSDPLPEKTFAARLAWLEQFRTVLAINEAALVGTSYGALVARLFAAAHPQAVPALVLINGGALPAKSGGFTRLLAQTPLVNNLIFGQISRQMVGSRKAMQWLVQHPKPAAPDDENDNADDDDEQDHGNPPLPTPPDPITEAMLATASENAPALTDVMRMQILSPVPQKRTPYLPTLILWGEQDNVSPVSIGKRVQNAIPGAAFTMISGTRHAPHIEEPEIVAFQIQSFLGNLGKSAKPDLPGAGLLG